MADDIISTIITNTIGILPFTFADNTVTLSLPEGVVIVTSEGVMVITPSTLYSYREQYCYLISSSGSTIEEGARYAYLIPGMTITSWVVIYRTYLISRSAGNVIVSDIDRVFSYLVRSHYRRLTITMGEDDKVFLTEEREFLTLRVIRKIADEMIFDFALTTMGNYVMKIMCDGILYVGIPPLYDWVIGMNGRMVRCCPADIMDKLLDDERGIITLLKIYG